jgi:glycosyltransferase involved in cell wall biosynthesis
MRVLFIKPALVYPRTSGHDVYCYFMMKGLAALGAEVALATVAKTDPAAVEGMNLVYCGQLSEEETAATRPKLTWLQERFRSFWGVSWGQIQSVRDLTSTLKADVVVAFGLPALPFLAGVEGALRVWAMADEWVYHHLTQVHLTDRTSWHHLKSALIKGAYERAYAPLVDRIWAVSDTDQRAAKWLAGMPVGDLLPNGVDTDFFHPIAVPEIPQSAVFWGRLDFEPNIDALVWFGREVWPEIARRVPAARFTIMGYQPTQEVERVAALPGITLRPNVPDLRSAVCEHALVVLPMVSGGGIKNKLLEGAAMGRPIVCTPRACMDLRSSGTLPMLVARKPDEWVMNVIALWDDEARRAELGRQARAWVSEYYSWAIPARGALEAFTRAVSKRSR